MKKTRDRYKLLEAIGVACPWCEATPCAPDCRKRWFDRGFAIGYHDGANNLDRHDRAFIVEMLETGEIE